MRAVGFGYFGFGLGGALDDLKTVGQLNSYLDMRWNEASQVTASDAMSIYDSVRSTFSKYPGSTSLIPLAEWGTAYNKLKDAYNKIEAKRAYIKKEADKRGEKAGDWLKWGVEKGVEVYGISKQPGVQTPTTQVVLTPGGAPTGPSGSEPLPKWVLPVAIGGGALFFLMMMTMMIVKRNPGATVSKSALKAIQDAGWKLPQNPTISKMPKSFCPCGERLYLISESKSATSFKPAYFFCSKCGVARRPGHAQ